MSWRDNLRPASFRGVPFKVKGTETSYGRRQVVHEFPQVDIPYTEDMGRKADEFTVEGHVIGDDYHLALEALIKACRDEAGPGTLVHPYRGERIVVCRGLRVRETSDDGRMATVVMTFLEAGEALQPSVIEDAPAVVRAAATSVREAAKRAFVDRFITDGLPGFVLAAATDLVADLASLLEAPTDLVTSNAEAAADFAYSVRRLGAEANDLAAAPEDLATLVDDTLDLMRRAFVNSGDALQRLFDGYDGEATLVAETPSRRQEKANDDAMSGLVRQLAIAQASTAAADAEHASYQDAKAVRDGLTERVDAEAETTTDDDVYAALMALRTTVVQAVPAQDQALPYLMTYTPPITLPSLVIAYQIYGDASREADIVARNNPVHPGFMTGGRPLEVLSDG